MPLRVTPVDYLSLDFAADGLPLPDGAADLELRCVQPHGYEQTHRRQVTVRDGACAWQLTYPLLDDGRYEQTHAPGWREWPYGDYRFAARLTGAAGARAELAADLPVEDLWVVGEGRPAGELYVPAGPHGERQLLHAWPHRPYVVDAPEQGLSLRLLEDRAAPFEADVDVVAAGTDGPALAGPWVLPVGRRTVQRRWDTAGWPPGEYWIRLRARLDGAPVGPWCVRLFVVEAVAGSASRAGPTPLAAGTSWIPAVDGGIVFATVEGARFAPEVLPRPPAPFLVQDRPWEGERLHLESIRHDADHGFEATYTTDSAHPDLKARIPRRPTRLLARSRDGVSWEKPEVGAVEFESSRANNILPAAPASWLAGKNPVDDDEARRAVTGARFERYDRSRHGSVNLDEVFVLNSKRGFPHNTEAVLNALAQAPPPQGDGRFRPGAGDWFAYEDRGDGLYLVLNPEPLIRTGYGYDSSHSTESCRFHVEVASRGGLYFYYRPSPPAYGNWESYDNLKRGLRSAAVLWTADGLHWERRHVLGGDELDTPGTAFYAMRVLAPQGSAVRVAGRAALRRALYPAVAVSPQPLYLGTVLHYQTIEGHLWPELIWSQDLVRWHRYGHQRRSLIAQGPHGSHDWGWARDQSADLLQVGDDWWFPYSTGPGLHGQGAAVGFAGTDQDFAETFAHWARYPHFGDWASIRAEGAAYAYAPALTRCKAWRLAHAESAGHDTAHLVTRPLLAGGDTVELNAAVDPGGSIQVEVCDPQAGPLPGRRFTDGGTVVGDGVALPVDAPAFAAPMAGRPVRLRFRLHRARLYAFRFP